MKALIQRILLAIALLFGTLVQAAPTPEEQVNAGIAAVTQAFETHQASFEQNPDALFQALDAALAPYVEFRRISASVMGRYFSSATPEQRSAFVRVFRDSLVRTFGRGLMAFDYREFDLQLRQRPMRNPNQANVELDVLAASGERYPVVFILENIQGEWKVVNLVVNGINLGLTFRNQFEQSMNQYRRDYDQVTANWTAEAALDEIQGQEDTP